MPRSNSTSYLRNPKLKAEGVKQNFTLKQLQEYQKCLEDPIYFIKNYVKIVNVDKGEIPFKLYDFQEEMVTKFVNNRFTLVKCPRQVGKALSLKTPIPTPTGWTTLEFIKAGDFVFGSDGKPTRVIEDHGVLYGRDCYEVRFDNDDVIVADGEHLWTVNNSDWNDSKTLTTQELLKILPRKQKNGSGIRISLAPSVEFSSGDLPIPSYVLGLWLGDGSSHNGQYTGAKNDVEHINQVLIENGYNIAEFCPKKDSVAGVQTIYGLMPQLRKLGVLKNKHIPEAYLNSSYEDRLSLLQGLMDSDGSCTNHNGVCEFYQKNQAITHSVRRLLASLGIKSTLSYKTIENQKYYTVRFSTTESVFRLPRKHIRQNKTKGSRTIKNVYIQEIRRVSSEPVKCISVAAEDSLYLAGDTMIPTHNSITTCSFLLWTILFKEQQNIAILANKFKTSQKLLADLKKSYMGLPFWLQQGVVEWNKGNIELENGCKLMASSTSSDAIRGNAFNLIFLDEFAFVPPHIAEEFFNSVYPTITSGETTKVIIVSTPNGMNMFHKMWIEANNPRDSKDPTIQWNGYEPFSITWRMVPHPNGKGGLRDEEWKQNIIKSTSEQQFRQEFECEFIGSSNTLIDPDKLNNLTGIVKRPKYQMPMVYSKFRDGTQAFMDVHEDPVPGHQYILCADVSGGKEQDSSAFVVFDISVMPYRIVAKYQSDKIPPMVYPDVVAQAATKYNKAFVLVETNDNGSDVAKTLQMDLEYENLITTTTKAKGTQVGGGFSRNVEFGIRSNKATKKIGCSNLKTLIEADKLLIEDYHIITELTQFVSNTRGSYSAEEGKHDDLVICLVHFSWLVNQQYFKELTETDIYGQLKRDYDSAVEEDMTPFGFIDDGRGSFHDDDGIKL